MTDEVIQEPTLDEAVAEVEVDATVVADPEPEPEAEIQPAPEGSIEEIERESSTGVSRQFRQLAGLDDQPE